MPDLDVTRPWSFDGLTEWERSMLLAEPRFASKVRFTDECWEWTACLNEDGYGQFWWHGRIYRAHRAALILCGVDVDHEMSNGLMVDHLCRNPACVRPSHLDLVTNLDNMFRSPYFGTPNTCKHGHRLDETTCVRRLNKRTGYLLRVCLVCEAIRNRKYYARMKEVKP